MLGTTGTHKALPKIAVAVAPLCGIIVIADRLAFAAQPSAQGLVPVVATAIFNRHNPPQIERELRDIELAHPAKDHATTEARRQGTRWWEIIPQASLKCSGEMTAWRFLVGALDHRKVAQSIDYGLCE